MRGPGYRASGDVRRVWRCSKCGKERKRMGWVTTMQCECQPEEWMQIVNDRTLAPRPLQRPTEIEKRPSDYGIEAPPPPPPKPTATIIKGAISPDVEPVAEQATQPAPETKATPEPTPAPEKDDWDFELE